MKTVFDDSWRDWIRTNIQRGCDRAGMAAILLEHGFEPGLVAGTLGLTATQPPPRVTAGAASPIERRETASADVEPHVDIPRARKLDAGDHALELYTVDNFLDEQECIDLVTLVRAHLRPSTTTNDAGEYASFRTSKTCDLGLTGHPAVDALDRRLCAVMGIHPSYTESLQAHWYDVGEEFKLHTDYFEPDTPEFDGHARERGQRTWTFMIYLNSTLGGGGTRFPRVPLDVRPRAGMAVIWNNLRPDGSPNGDSAHWGMPVTRGFKVIITKWFREKGRGEMFRKQPAEYLPAYTDRGFVKRRIPEALFERLRQFYDAHAGDALAERLPDYITGPSDGDHAPSELVELSPELKRTVHETLQPQIEAWIGHFVEPTVVFGIRRYLNGAALKPHRDRAGTHVASSILNISQRVDEPWPLVIEDHRYRVHHVWLEPGEMLFYEGARLLHGRPQPLRGDHFANVFAHYTLAP